MLDSVHNLVSSIGELFEQQSVVLRAKDGKMMPPCLALRVKVNVTSLLCCPEKKWLHQRSSDWASCEDKRLDTEIYLTSRNKT